MSCMIIPRTLEASVTVHTHTCTLQWWWKSEVVSLVWCVWLHYRKGHDFTQQKLKALYVTHSSQFPEVEEFVEQAISHYSLDPIQISGLGIKESLSQLKHSHPQFKAIMMGTRHTDPYSGMTVIHLCGNPSNEDPEMKIPRITGQFAWN